jgi:hypothetical protein
MLFHRASSSCAAWRSTAVRRRYSPTAGGVALQTLRGRSPMVVLAARRVPPSFSSEWAR